MGKEVDEIEEDEYSEIIAENRHNELSSSLKTIAKTLLEQNDKAVVEAINGQGEKVAALVKAIESIPKPEKPIVNVEVNNEKLLSLINEMKEDIIDSNNKVIQALESRLLPDSFELIKNYGVTQSVKVNYKQANLINNKK